MYYISVDLQRNKIWNKNRRRCFY